MNDKRKAPDAADGAPRRKRAAPTIDLTATEVAPDAASAAAPETAPEPAQAAQPEPPPAAARTERPQAPQSQAAARISAGTVAAGFAGGLIVAVLFGLLWLAGLLPGGSRGEAAQIAALQKQLGELQNRPVPASDTPALDALRQRIAKIERDAANLPPGDKTIAERLAAADSAMKSLGIALTALTQRNDDIANNAREAQARAVAAEKAVAELRASVANAKQQAATAIDAGQLDAVRQRVAALEASLKSAREQIAANATVDRPARLALSAAALRAAVESGAPYQAELAQAQSLGADAQALAPLAPFAASGVPSRQALARELTALIPALVKSSGAQQAPSGFLERLQANAGRLVRVAPVDAPPGNSPSDLLARIEVAAAHGDIAAALADLGKLPEAARAPAQGFVAKARAREAALAAARKLAADTARVLGK